MPRRPTELSILDLVEHPRGSRGESELTANESGLSADAVELVAGMRRDREVLRTLAEPALPQDFVALLSEFLEPPAPQVSVAKGFRGLRLSPLHWIATRPSSGRLAAALSLAACGGAAVATAVLIAFDGRSLAPAVATPEAGAVVVLDADSGEARRAGTAGGLSGGLSEGDAGPLLAGAAGARGRSSNGGDRHHLSGSREQALALSTEAGGGASPPSPDGTKLVGTELDGAEVGGLGRGAVALVIRTERLDTGVAALRQAIQACAPSDSALVRNVTLREAADLDLRLRAAAGQPSRLLAMASRGGDLAGSQAAGSQTSVDGAVRRETPAGSRGGARTPGERDAPTGIISGAPQGLRDAGVLGEHLAGSRAAATAPDLQLELSEDGFSYSVTLPVERLRDLLVALAFDESVSIRLGRRETLVSATGGQSPGSGSSAVTGSAASGAEESSVDAWRRWQEATSAMAAIERSLPKGSRVTLAVRVDPRRE